MAEKKSKKKIIPIIIGGIVIAVGTLILLSKKSEAAPLNQTHRECQNGNCVEIDGAGVNQCNANLDCQPLPSQIIINSVNFEVCSLDGINDMLRINVIHQNNGNTCVLARLELMKNGLLLISRDLGLYCPSGDNRYFECIFDAGDRFEVIIYQRRNVNENWVISDSANGVAQ